MNKYDSQLIATMLESDEHIPVDDFRQADLILVNTCAVRKHAEDRALGRLAFFSGLKKSNKRLLIGIVGCVAARLKDELFNINPHIDFVVGPQEFHRIPEIVRDKKRGIVRCGVGGFTATGIYPRASGSSTFISIMRGCNNFCSYCVVPYLRGREISRPLDDIMKEAELVIDQGVKEIILLGQNVNSWRDREFALPDLLERLVRIHGLERVRFITNHPKDMSQRLIETMRDNPKICKSIHLPIQSGSNRILKLMNRGYTREDYLNIVDSLRDAMPDISITTDIIAGFPTETEEDFNQTLELVQRVSFDGIFSFYYSPRPLTKASRMDGQLPREIKIKRLERLIKIANSLAKKRTQRFIGRIEEVLIEGVAKKNPGSFMGRNEADRIVIFPDTGDLKTGDIVTVKIKDASVWALFGNIYEKIKAS